MRFAIVSGTSRGLGEAHALRRLALGFHVVGIARTNSGRLADDAAMRAESRSTGA